MSTDVSNGANRLSLTGLDREKEWKEDTTLQSGLYEFSESGSKLFGCSKFCVQSFGNVSTSLEQLRVCYCTNFVLKQSVFSRTFLAFLRQKIYMSVSAFGASHTVAEHKQQ